MLKRKLDISGPIFLNILINQDDSEHQRLTFFLKFSGFFLERRIASSGYWQARFFKRGIDYRNMFVGKLKKVRKLRKICLCHSVA
jgi:hypothetical protein